MGEPGVGIVRTERNAGSIGYRGLQQQVALVRVVDIIHRAEQGLSVGRLQSQFAVRFKVAHHRFGSASQHYLRGGDTLVPLLIEEVETGCKGIGGLLVEMVLRHRVELVGDQRQTLDQVGVDLGIDIGQRTAGVFGVEYRFGLLHVGDAKVFRRILRIVSLTEHIGQTEMSVCTANERFALGGLQLRGVGAAQLLDGVERLVGSGNRHVILTPYGLRRFVGNGRRNVLPAVVLFLFGFEVR